MVTVTYGTLIGGGSVAVLDDALDDETPVTGLLGVEEGTLVLKVDEAQTQEKEVEVDEGVSSVQVVVLLTGVGDAGVEDVPGEVLVVE